MEIHTILVPYDSGHRGVRMGAGPEHLVDNGALRTLELAGHVVSVQSVVATTPFPSEIKTAFELCRTVSALVRETLVRRAFPLVLSGNCNSCLGTLAGLNRPNPGIVWFDAHGDFNNPETSDCSFFDGMGLSIATGHCWKRLAASIQGFHPVPDSKVIHVGGRDFDQEERVLLENSEMQLVEAAKIRSIGLSQALVPALDRLRSRVDGIYLHLDLDVLDPRLTPANQYGARVPDGLSVDQVVEAISIVSKKVRIYAGGVAAYDPSFDAERKTFEAGVKVIDAIVQGSSQRAEKLAAT